MNGDVRVRAKGHYHKDFQIIANNANAQSRMSRARMLAVNVSICLEQQLVGNIRGKKVHAHTHHTYIHTSTQRALPPEQAKNKAWNPDTGSVELASPPWAKSLTTPFAFPFIQCLHKEELSFCCSMPSPRKTPRTAATTQATVKKTWNTGARVKSRLE